MTLDEAIRDLNCRLKFWRKKHPEVNSDDIQLGIEALERQKGLREMASLYTKLKFSNIPDIIKRIKSLLPSETGRKE